MDNLMELAVKEKRDVVRPERQTNCRPSSLSPLLQIQCPSSKSRSAVDRLLRPPPPLCCHLQWISRSAPLTFLPAHPVFPVPNSNRQSSRNPLGYSHQPENK